MLSASRLRAVLTISLFALAATILTASAQEPGHKDTDAHKHGEHQLGEHKDHKDAHDAGHKEHTALDHVLDTWEWHFFDTLWPQHWHMPWWLSKFMLLELLAALIVVAIYIPLARRLQSGEPPRGAWDNAFETLLTFVRDQIAKPSLGEDIADLYVPFLWTLFLFILVNNLLGMFPFLGSATASIWVTGALALIVFFAIHGSAIVAMGKATDHGHGHHGHGHDHHGHDEHGHGHVAHAEQHSHSAETQPSVGEIIGRGSVRYALSIWPQIDLPIPVMGTLIKILVLFIEIVGILVRNAVLAVRLFANMFAGHMVLATILLFIKMAANVHPIMWGTITLTSVLGILALSLLELFVAFLQAYIFTFLTALFMGMAVTPQH
jgi:F-type H+-transporting ATPase subunit a